MRPDFIEVNGRRLFAIRFGPPAPVRRCLIVHSLFEEMNKSRAVVARSARTFAEVGIQTVVVDPFGTGDSEGDFEEASWDIWRDDLKALIDDFVPTDILAIRAGALLLSAALAGRPADAELRTTLVQPVPVGKGFLSQFLRLRIAASKFAGRAETQQDLEAALAAGENVEVAGYALTRKISEGLGAARWQATPGVAVDCVEIGPSSRTEPSKPIAGLLAEARDAGCPVRWSAVTDERFWTTTELAAAPALNATLVELVSGPGP